MIGLGIRVTKEIDNEETAWWHIELRAEEEFVPAFVQPRTWRLPADVEVLETWKPDTNSVNRAVDFALVASEKGCVACRTR